MEETYYTPQDVAEILNVSPSTVKNWIKKGDLIGNKMGRFYRINKMDLENFINKTKIKGEN